MKRPIGFLLLGIGALVGCVATDGGEGLKSTTQDIAAGETHPAGPNECQLGSGMYCGGNGVSGLTNVLYECKRTSSGSSTVTVKEVCKSEDPSFTPTCRRAPAGDNDACARPPGSQKRVGLYNGRGAGDGVEDKYLSGVIGVLKGDPRFELDKFTVVGDGFNDRFDVVIFPGGLGDTQWSGLSWNGQEKLKSFVRGGKGLIGICAGFYLALSYNSGFVQGDFHPPWNRGTGTVQVKLTDNNGVFSISGTHPFTYENGPVFAPTNPPGPGYKVLATFASSVGWGEVQMAGQPAVVASDYGRGRVVEFSPHPELSGLGTLLKDAVLWTATPH